MFRRPPRLTSREDLGITLIEVMIAVAISSVVLVSLWNLYAFSSRVLTGTTVQTQADVNLRFAMDEIETSLLNVNYFDVATSSEVSFTADLITDPDYQPNADFDADGIVNLQDPDDDNDATLIQPPTAQWKIGYDLKDDDDDSDNQNDMRWKIYISTSEKTIYRDYSKNGEVWGQHVESILTHVATSSVFTFYGSMNDLLSQGGANLDTDGNGMITENEIDEVGNGGNGNGVLDTVAERDRIITVDISLDQDKNGDGNVESRLSTEVMPPSLYLKRRP